MSSVLTGRFDNKFSKTAYKDDWEHISEQLKLLELKLLKYLLLTQSEDKDERFARFRGLVLTADEISDILLQKSEVFVEHDLIKDIEKQIDLGTEHILRRMEKSSADNVFLVLPHIKAVFCLSDFEYEVFLLSLASELDERFSKIFGYIQDNIIVKYPTVAFALKLLKEPGITELQQLRAFSPDACLPTYFYSTLALEHSELPYSTTALKLDRHLVDFIINPNILDTETASFVSLFKPSENIPELLTDKHIQVYLSNLLKTQSWSDNSRSSVIINLHGPCGTGKKLHVKHLARKYSKNILFVDLKAILLSNNNFSEIVHKLMRDSILNQAVICYMNFDSMSDAQGSYNERIQELFSIGDSYRKPFILLSEAPCRPGINIEGYQLYNINIDPPNDSTRKLLWNEFSSAYVLSADIDKEALASKFEFTHLQIKNALEDAYKFSCLNGCAEIDIQNLHTSCYKQVTHNLEDKATLVKPNYNWADLILPYEQTKILQNACNQVKNRFLVFEKWGFDKKLSYGKGLSMLFSGPPGTGKTMAAQVIANELHLEMYKVQLSQVVSKYIGETEKNLKDIFDESRKSNTILFFDETDALLGKRSEIKDSHDRYANIETAFLLQEIETHVGITIMATNFKQNIDEAFMRRINFVANFPFPDKLHRKKIWVSMFPKNTPLDENIDFDFLADKFELSGGSIKNIVVSSAFLAAEDNEAVNMNHIISALKYELSKTGKIVLKEDLGEWGS